MLYVKTVTVPANTPSNTPVESTVEIEEDTIVMIAVRFPPGPIGLLKVAVFYGEEQIFPSKDYEWVSGDYETVLDFPLWDVPEKPCTITVKAYNEDTIYDHSFTIRVLALPKSYVILLKMGSYILNILRLLLSIFGGKT